MFTQAAVETLDGIMRDPKEQAVARIRAAEILLDRGYGKPAQAISAEVTTNATGPRLVIVTAGKDAEAAIDAEPNTPTIVLPDNKRGLPGAEQTRPQRPIAEPQPPPASRPSVEPSSSRIPTVRVLTPDGRSRVINRDSFDPTKHELVDEAPPKSLGASGARVGGL